MVGSKTLRTLVAVFAAAAVATALGAFARPAGAALGVACPDPNSQVFLPWDDASFFAYVPNGGFESGSTGWTLSNGAKVVDGNESFGVRDDGGTHSLALPAGSRATTPPMCIGLLSSHMRFFVQNTGSPWSRLK